jgi:hypothetical protein
MGVEPDVLVAAKAATGAVAAAPTVIYASFDIVALPAEFMAVIVTVKGPVVV